MPGQRHQPWLYIGRAGMTINPIHEYSSAHRRHPHGPQLLFKHRWEYQQCDYLDLDMAVADISLGTSMLAFCRYRSDEPAAGRGLLHHT